ncbi:hypothetical protein Hanom_Chr05g00439911 [Helianthus anomalus]
MHIRNDPSFFLTKRTGAPQGEVLGRIKPFSSSSWSWFESSRISEGASRLLLLLLLGLLGFLLDYPVRAPVCKVVRVTTCKTGPNIGCWGLSGLLNLRSREQSLIDSGLSLSLTGTIATTRSEMPVNIAVSAESASHTHWVVIRTRWAEWMGAGGGQNSSIMIAFSSSHVSSYAASFPRLFLSAVHQSKARDWKTPVALRVRR